MKTKERAAIAIIAGAFLGGYASTQLQNAIAGIAIGVIAAAAVYFLTR
jgi:hypothetical protein